MAFKYYTGDDVAYPKYTRVTLHGKRVWGCAVKRAVEERMLVGEIYAPYFVGWGVQPYALMEQLPASVRHVLLEHVANSESPIAQLMDLTEEYGGYPELKGK